MNDNIFSTSDLIKQIREYQKKNKELLNSNHFVFDCPLSRNSKESPEIIWMGINPGDDSMAKKFSIEERILNPEETRDYNFQLNKRTPESQKMMNNLQRVLGVSKFFKTSLTEMFFWASTDIGEGFKKRYGYPFHNNRHMSFCLKINKELFKRANPKYIIGPHYAKKTKDRINIIKNYFNLKLIKEHRNTINNEVFIEQYIMDDKYQYINCKFIGRANYVAGEKQEMREKIQEIIK